jgi:hypothetical protein
MVSATAGGVASREVFMNLVEGSGSGSLEP